MFSPIRRLLIDTLPNPDTESREYSTDPNTGLIKPAGLHEVHPHS